MTAKRLLLNPLHALCRQPLLWHGLLTGVAILLACLAFVRSHSACVVTYSPQHAIVQFSRELAQAQPLTPAQRTQLIQRFSNAMAASLNTYAKTHHVTVLLRHHVLAGSHAVDAAINAAITQQLKRGSSHA